MDEIKNLNTPKTYESSGALNETKDLLEQLTNSRDWESFTSTQLHRFIEKCLEAGLLYEVVHTQWILEHERIDHLKFFEALDIHNLLEDFYQYFDLFDIDFKKKFLRYLIVNYFKDGNADSLLTKLFNHLFLKTNPMTIINQRCVLDAFLMHALNIDTIVQFLSKYNFSFAEMYSGIIRNNAKMRISDSIFDGLIREVGLDNAFFYFFRGDITVFIRFLTFADKLPDGVEMEDIVAYYIEYREDAKIVLEHRETVFKDVADDAFISLLFKKKSYEILATFIEKFNKNTHRNIIEKLISLGKGYYVLLHKDKVDIGHQDIIELFKKYHQEIVLFEMFYTLPEYSTVFFDKLAQRLLDRNELKQIELYLHLFSPEFKTKIIHRILFTKGNSKDVSHLAIVPYIDYLELEDKLKFVHIFLYRSNFVDDMPQLHEYLCDILDKDTDFNANIAVYIAPIKALIRSYGYKYFFSYHFYDFLIFFAQKVNLSNEIKTEISLDDFKNIENELGTSQNNLLLLKLKKLKNILYPDQDSNQENPIGFIDDKDVDITTELHNRERYKQFEILSEIYYYYIAQLQEATVGFVNDFFTHKIDILFNVLKEYMIVAVTSELGHSMSKLGLLELSEQNAALFNAASKDKIAAFFIRAEKRFNEDVSSVGYNSAYGGLAWAKIAQLGLQFWMDEQPTTQKKLFLINLAVSYQHHNGYIFDKDPDRLPFNPKGLQDLLNYEASGNIDIDTFLQYGLNKGIITNNEIETLKKQFETTIIGSDQTKSEHTIDFYNVNEYLNDQLQNTVTRQRHAQIGALFSSWSNIHWQNIDYFGNNMCIYSRGNISLIRVTIMGTEYGVWVEDDILIKPSISTQVFEQQLKKLTTNLGKEYVSAYLTVKDGD